MAPPATGGPQGRKRGVSPSDTLTLRTQAPAPHPADQAATAPPGVVDPFSADEDTRIHKVKEYLVRADASNLM